MPINTNDWTNYCTYLIETYHPIAKAIFKDFKTIQNHRPGMNGPVSYRQWKNDSMRFIVQHHQIALNNWSKLLLPAQKKQWDAFIQPYLAKPFDQKLYYEINDFLRASYITQLRFKDYAYYYQHHQVGVDDSPKVMNLRAEPIFNQIQIIETKLVQIATH